MPLNLKLQLIFFSPVLYSLNRNSSHSNNNFRSFSKNNERFRLLGASIRIHRLGFVPALPTELTRNCYLYFKQFLFFTNMNFLHKLTDSTLFQVNAIFLVNIVTVLIMKLRTGHLDEHMQFR